MASHLPRHVLAASCLLLLTAMVGCAGPGGTANMQARPRYPQPNLTGPNLSAPPAAVPVDPKPIAIAPQPKPAPQPPKVAPAPTPSYAGVPAAWVPKAPVRKWEWIVIHHSATTVGGAARFGKEHVARGFDELGYHFVVGNGTDTPNGVIEVGSRWPKQKQGAHCKTPNNDFNEKGIGICLVGNFDQSQPTAVQMAATAKLVAHLMKTYNIPADRVIGHGDAKSTDCPGKFLKLAQVRRMSTQALADAGETVPPSRTATVAAGQEMMFDAGKRR
ncbi:MAG TPA: peptidoglycan recognition family protein [Humisphaera sp.]